MKKFILRLLIFGVIFVCIDFAIDNVFSTVASKAIGGNTYRHNMVAYETKADIIFMGSSRCLHHYDSKAIADDLKCTCWNAGQEGEGILMMYPFYKILSQRYTPKLIVYDLWLYDVEEDDHTRYLEWIRRFYDVPGVDSVVWDLEPDERYKMMCRTYRYNGYGLYLFYDMVRNTQSNVMGYIPLYGYNVKKDLGEGIAKVPQQKSIDPLKEKYLIKLIQDCRRNGTKIVFMISPYYGTSTLKEYYSAIKSLCANYDVPFISHESDGELQNPYYFHSEGHLNNIGVEKYTRTIEPEIKDILSRNSNTRHK